MLGASGGGGGGGLESDLSMSSCSIGSVGVGDNKRGNNSGYVWQSGSVMDWTKEQVCQWLLGLGLEQHIGKFLELQVGGASLVQLTSADFKLLGVAGEDKQRLKRKLKELRAHAEKERKQLERERKEREKQMRKAEKAASRRK